ncbi:DNA repair protein RadA, partial [Enterococcus faecium]
FLFEQGFYEVQNVGLTKEYLPKNNLGNWEAPKGIEIVGVATLAETLMRVFR